jgi:hypothetical protein
MIVAICLILSAVELDTPVVIISMSISPVVGSVALYYIAALIKRTASSTSFFSTVSDSLIFAKASEILIIDSNYLGVAVIVFLEIPIFRILAYSWTRSITI